jgi:FkbM family methyltransferase
MKKRVYNFLKKTFVHPLATRFGYVPSKLLKRSILNGNEKKDLLCNFYSTLKKINFQPKHIVDIGANHGTWSREALRYFPDTYITMIEPQAWLKNSFDDLLSNNPRVTYHAVGAGKQSGSFKFTIHDRDDSCSFKYSEEEASLNGYKQIELPVLTLNEILNNSHFPKPDMIKIDAEGLDLEVLEGASDYFGITEIFLVEAGVVNKEFSNNFLELSKYMDDKGYRLFELTDINRPFDLKVLWLVELVFVKKGGYLDSLKLNISSVK